MHRNAIIAIVVIFVLIVAGMFTFTFLKQRELKVDNTPNATSTTPVATDPYASITRVDAKHFFIDGVHTLVGEIAMPTPCDLLEATSTVDATLKTQVGIQFSVVNTADYCAQVITNQRFKVTATAPAAATFTATFMGRPIELNLIPPAAGETPDDFELFTKG